MKHVKKVDRRFKYTPAIGHTTPGHLRETFRRERARLKAEAERRARDEQEQHDKVSPLKVKGGRP